MFATKSNLRTIKQLGVSPVCSKGIREQCFVVSVYVCVCTRGYFKKLRQTMCGLKIRVIYMRAIAHALAICEPHRRANQTRQDFRRLEILHRLRATTFLASCYDANSKVARVHVSVTCTSSC